MNPLSGCGVCALCRLGLENLCPKRQIIGIHRPGAFAELVAAPAASCTMLPDGLSQVAGSLAEPLGCGVRAARIGAVGAGSRVLVLGAGTIGLMCIAAARKAGGSVTLAADPNAGRLQTAAQWGAEHLCDTRADDPAEVARQLTDGLGVDVAIDAVGTDTTRRVAVRAVRPGGTVVLVGLHEAESPFEANYIVRSEIRVAGSFAYTQADFDTAVAMLAAGDVAPAASWLQERDLGRLRRLLRRADRQPAGGVEDRAAAVERHWMAASASNLTSYCPSISVGVAADVGGKGTWARRHGSPGVRAPGLPKRPLPRKSCQLRNQVAPTPRPLRKP